MRGSGRTHLNIVRLTYYCEEVRRSRIPCGDRYVREASFTVLDAFYNFTDLLRQLPSHNWEKLLTQMLYHHEETAHDWAEVKFTAQIQPGFNPFERFQRNEFATA